MNLVRLWIVETTEETTWWGSNLPSPALESGTLTLDQCFTGLY